MQGPPFGCRGAPRLCRGASERRGAWGARSRPPMWSIHLGRLPGGHPPQPTGLRIDREIAHREALFLTVALDVHRRDAGDDPHVAMDARRAVARGDAAI